MFDWPVEWFDELDSTSEEARRRVQNGYFPNCWIAARTQTAGRGRLGREWRSPIGNLFATVLFHHHANMSEATKIPFVSALAVADVFEAFAKEHPIELKWPNDVRCRGAKLSGILTEAGPLDDGCWVAVGIGINVSEVPKNLDQKASSLAELRGNDAVTPDIALSELKSAFQKRMSECAQDFESTRRAWLSRAEGLGETISVKRGNDRITGVFEGLGANGELLLRQSDKELIIITAGDVELVKEKVI